MYVSKNITLRNKTDYILLIFFLINCKINLISYLMVETENKGYILDFVVGITKKT